MKNIFRLKNINIEEEKIINQLKELDIFYLKDTKIKYL